MEAFGIALLVFVVYGVTLICVGYCRRQVPSTVRLLYMNVMILYGLIAVILMTFPIDYPQEKAFYPLPIYSLISMEAEQVGAYLGMCGLQMLLFLPSGVFCGIHGTLKGEASLLSAIGFGFLSALLLEFLQAVLPTNHVFSTGQILLSMGASALGYGLFTVLENTQFMQRFLRNILYG